jgi:hypothetical protein
MISDTLNTNEVKNAAGTEVEFQLLQREGRTAEFAIIGEAPSLRHRLKVQHQEVGSGIKLRRRSVVRVDKTVISTVDNVTPLTCSAYAVLDAPVGGLAANTEMSNVLAELMSFMASLGASTTILYDCTGNGAKTLLAGSL